MSDKMRTMKWSREEKELFNQLEKLNDKDFILLLKKFNITINIGPPPLDSDERLLGAIALMTDVSKSQLIKEIKNLENK